MSIYIPRRKDGTPKSPFYTFDFVLKPAGQTRSQRFTGSTGQRTKEAARRVEAQMRELAATGKLGTLLTLGDACQRYKREVSDLAATAAARRQHDLCLAELIAYYGADTPLVSISPDLVAKVVAERAAMPVLVKTRTPEGIQWLPGDRLPSASTVNRQVVEPLRRVLRRARKHWKIPVDLDQFQWGGRDGLKLAEPEPRVRELSAAEEMAFWKELPSDYHALCELYIISGRRQSSWLDLTRFDVDLDRGAVRVRLLKKRKAGFQWIELTERELAIIAAELEKSKGFSAVFTAVSQRVRDKGKRQKITPRMLYAHVTAAMDRAGIKDFRPHDFRHTFASRALRHDPNLKKLQTAMDHSSIASTTRYAHVLQDDVTKMRAGVTVNRELPANVTRIKKDKP